jgi:cysteine synthase
MQRPLPALLRGPLLCGLLLCRMAASQATLTVDATGTGGAFTTVQAAISAASPGDRIRVLGTGPYPSFLVDRAVDIQGAGGTRVPGIEVTAVPAGQSARIAGFALDLPSNASIFRT